MSDLKKEGTDIKKSTQYLTFISGNEMYGIPVSQTREVIEFNKVYKIPRTPKYIRGVINLRGEVLPVLDLSYVFYNRPCEITMSTGVVFIESLVHEENVLIGLMIDSVESVVDISEDQISSIPEFSANINPKFISGIGKVENSFIVLLRLDEVVNIETMSKFKV